MLKKLLLITGVLSCSFYAGATSFATNVSGGTVTSNLSMMVKASCGAKVDDVAFGDQSAGSIKNGMVADKTMTLTVDCDTTLANYTISFSSADGVKDVTNGIIGTKENATVGYQLKWGNDSVKAVNTALAIDGVAIAPAKKPTTASFTVPIKVKPVALGASVSAGAANTALNIKLTFN